MVYADTGDAQLEITQNDVARIAQMWSGKSVKDARVSAVEARTISERGGEGRELPQRP